MKFQNAILSLATATLSGVNNNVVDAKLWNLRGFGNANNNNNEVMTKDYQSESLPSVVEEPLPSPSANLRELFINEHQGERKLPKDKKKQKKDKKKKGKDDEEEDEKKWGKKGEIEEKIGDAIYVDAPEDAAAKAGCDEDEDDGARFRRILKKGGKGKDSKAKKEDVSNGGCDSCKETGEPTAEEIELSGVDVPVEASDNPTCDPDDETSCMDEYEGEEADPLYVDPTSEEGEDEAIARQLMDERRLTGNTNQIGTFAPLSCNPVEFDCTGAAGLSTVLGGASDPVVVPCGVCLVVSVLFYPVCLGWVGYLLDLKTY
jgi:hypothetical protein